ncbi:MAG: carbohydrate ABC transporter permease [Burkholderiales bacterium]|nr:carbohydrate ABC transporter permease [Burkholderiales bacterium]
MTTLWTLLPIYWLLRMAAMSPADASAYPPPLWPHSLHPAALLNVLGFAYTDAAGHVFPPSGQSPQILLGLWNSIVVAVAVTVITILVIVPLAYAFARFEFRAKTGLLMAILFSVSVPPVSTLIPFYILFVDLGLAGTRSGLVLINLTVTVPFVTWMLIGYFRNLPPVERLARIDGFGRMATLLRIMIPMSKSGIAVAAVVSFLFAWNEFVFATALVNGTDATTLPTSVSGLMFLQPNPGQLAASLFLSLIPAGAVAYFLQHHIADLGFVDVVR